MVKIKPLKIKSYDESINIIKPSPYYNRLDPVERIRYLRQQLPIRMETMNQLVWSRYPPEELVKIDQSIKELSALAERTANTNLQMDILRAKELLNNLIFIFKNYEDMVALTTLLYYETDNLVEMENEEITEMKSRLTALEVENSKLKNKLREFGYLVPHVNMTLETFNHYATKAISAEEMLKQVPTNHDRITTSPEAEIPSNDEVSTEGERQMQRTIKKLVTTEEAQKE